LAEALARANVRFVLSHPAHLLSFGFGAGLVPAAPGTAGTLATFVLYWAVAPHLDATEYLVMVAAMFLVGVWACGVTGRALGVPDHGGIVWDEITAFMLVLYFTPPRLEWQAFAFLLFRGFDILKPPPIGYYDRRLKGGFGVMFDDLVAAFMALLVLALGQRLMG
jgi:phosphatidylglycerophosphatase A